MFKIRLESTFEIRDDIEQAAKRLNPVEKDNETIFSGYSRMALPIRQFKYFY